MDWYVRHSSNVECFFNCGKHGVVFIPHVRGIGQTRTNHRRNEADQLVGVGECPRDVLEPG